MKKILFAGVMLLAAGSGAWAQKALPSPEFCSLSQAVVGNVLGQLGSVVLSGNGELFKPNRMWVAVVDRKALQKRTWSLPVKNSCPGIGASLLMDVDEEQLEPSKIERWIIDPENFTVRAFFSDGSETAGLSPRLLFEEVLRPSWERLIMPTIRSMLSRVFSPLRRAAEGQPRSGPHYLPISGGWLPAGAGVGWWQEGHSLLAGERSAVVERCIGLYAQTISSLPPTHWKASGRGGRVRVTNSALSRILKKPNDYESISNFMLNAVRSLFLEGAGRRRNRRAGLSARWQ